ncbi:MAG: DUF4065 domain-containing protein [Chloroflexi bacterium]|nr:MAG: DUF4065 domain-containing protein [Chloroflexota bacterium]
MQFVFDERKTAQASAYLLSLQGGEMPYMKLIKLLYLADRQSLVESGYPITGDRLVSMDFGPVLSRVLTFIQYGTSAAWRQYIAGPVNYDVQLASPADTDQLSPYEIEVLDSVNERFGNLDQWQLVKYVHTLPEWEDPEGSMLPIDVRVILREAGKSDDEIRKVSSQVEAIHSFRSMYAASE